MTSPLLPRARPHRGTPATRPADRRPVALALLACVGLAGGFGGLAGCAPIATVRPAPLPRLSPVQTLIDQARADTAAKIAAAAASAPSAAPPAAPAAPAAVPAPVAAAEPRFDLIVNNAPARDVFLALAADGHYNLLTHPDLAGNLSLTLRRVTLREALEAIRDVYGFDFRIEGRRVTVFPPAMQSRVFIVNYLTSQRSGRSDVRVSSGAAPANGGSSSGSGTPGMPGAPSNNNSNNNGGGPPDSSQISTQSHNDLWTELGDAVKAMVGSAGGRSVIVSPQSGLLAVRAMPEELRQVEAMLSAARGAIERQVMLDVKIVQVDLREGFQSGIDWSALRGRGAVGSIGGSGSNALATNGVGLPVIPGGVSLLEDSLPLPTAGSGLFGLSLASNGFQAVLGFLETHGDVQTLSSPRLATLNNQKAVLKVGTDDYFVTNVSGGTVTNNGIGGNSNSSTTLPTLTLTPFFSGIALDVTPQIDEGHMITLHVHPSVSAVSERNKQVDLGTLGAYKLPLASSSINETDTIVRIPDGQIVAIGGLMQMETVRQTSGLPGSAENALTASVLGNRANSGRKKELVVLIKPSIIHSAEDWQDQTRAVWAALEGKDEPVRVIRIDGPAVAAPAAPALPAPAAAGSHLGPEAAAARRAAIAARTAARLAAAAAANATDSEQKADTARAAATAAAGTARSTAAAAALATASAASADPAASSPDNPPPAKKRRHKKPLKLDDGSATAAADLSTAP